MELLTVQNLTFQYAALGGETAPVKTAIQNLSFQVEEGEFVLLCGLNGSGKTTLLRLLKPATAPVGSLQGDILYKQQPLYQLPFAQQTTQIGYVAQNANMQFVTDTVWQELAFGLENSGVHTSEIRRRVGEMASFFGLEHEMYKKANALSAGQKQTVNLAAVLLQQPSLLLLDEPTASLDPIATENFLQLVQKVNREFGTAILLSEQKIEQILPMAHKTIVLKHGEIICNATPAEMAKEIWQTQNPLLQTLPTPVQVALTLQEKEIPFTIQAGRRQLAQTFLKNKNETEVVKTTVERAKTEVALQADKVWFRYEKKGNDILKGISLSVRKGEVYCLMGENGGGKTTLLNLFSKEMTPYSGKIMLEGKVLTSYKETELFSGLLGILPQNPQFLFTEDTLLRDLQTTGAAENIVLQMAEQFHIGHLLPENPLDFSGGEMQRAALAKVMLRNPQIILLDEPTNALDIEAKKQLGEWLCKWKEEGKTIFMISHDMNFVAEYADRCALLFDGEIAGEEDTKNFFLSNLFYTTQARRLTRGLAENITTTQEVLALCEQSKTSTL